MQGCSRFSNMLLIDAKELCATSVQAQSAENEVGKAAYVSRTSGKPIYYCVKHDLPMITMWLEPIRAEQGIAELPYLLSLLPAVKKLALMLRRPCLLPWETHKARQLSRKVQKLHCSLGNTQNLQQTPRRGADMCKTASSCT